MIFRTAALIPAIALVTACAIPEDNTLTRSDANAFAADDDFASDLDFTPDTDVPAGRATYEGHIRSDAIVNGERDFEVIGLMELGVNIGEDSTRRGASNVNGSITEINLFDNANDGFDDQRLTGTLNINGSTTGGRIEAEAIGVISGVLEDGPTNQDATWRLNMDGDFRDNFENADIVAGGVTGGTAGSGSDQYDLLLTGDGRFYGERLD